MKCSINNETDNEANKKVYEKAYYKWLGLK